MIYLARIIRTRLARGESIKRLMAAHEKLPIRRNDRVARKRARRLCLSPRFSPLFTTLRGNVFRPHRYLTDSLVRTAAHRRKSSSLRAPTCIFACR